MAHDTDSFNRWDAGNRLSSRVILALASLQSVADIEAASLPADYKSAMRAVLVSCTAPGSDPSLAAYALQLPDEMTLSQDMTVIDVDKLHSARHAVKKALAAALKTELQQTYQDLDAKGSPYVFSAPEVGRRRLRNTVLDYLSADRSQEAAVRAKKQFDEANCMSDRLSALGCLVSLDCPQREEALAAFHTFARGDALVLNKWFAIQAMADLPDLLGAVKKLKTHPDFILSNPNRARSLISTFAGNMAKFHAADGQGYAFISDCILEIDRLNPQVAARLASSFSQWRRFDASRQALMQVHKKCIQHYVSFH